MERISNFLSDIKFDDSVNWIPIPHFDHQKDHWKTFIDFVTWKCNSNKYIRQPGALQTSNHSKFPIGHNRKKFIIETTNSGLTIANWYWHA